MKRKTYVFDLETSLIEALTFGPMWEADLVYIIKHAELLCFSYKELGSRKAYVYSQRGFKTQKELIGKLWEMANEASVLIAHNGKSFDVRMMNTFFIANGFPPPAPYKLIDTKLVAKRYFRFPSNSLNELAAFFGLEGKMDTGGKELWLKCRAGDEKAWSKMERYNKRDVVLLEEVYQIMEPWIENHPDKKIYVPGKGCHRCGEEDTQKRGMKPRVIGWVQEYLCKKCGQRLYTDIIERWPAISGTPSTS